MENKPDENLDKPVDNSQNTVDNSDKPVDNSQNTVDNSDKPVDNSESKDKPVDKSGDDFDPQKYLDSLEPKEDSPDLNKVLQENDLLKKKLDAVTGAYLDLKKTGVTVVSNPATNTPQQDPNALADKMLQKWMHS